MGINRRSAMERRCDGNEYGALFWSKVDRSIQLRSMPQNEGHEPPEWKDYASENVVGVNGFVERVAVMLGA
jgi:hypothetical protein